ncbi:MAG: hypothetical protein KAI33_01215, partial [Elusimicrobiales bacterium]|nr:hypothetical protein [Elusimicrobiales bacterium]
MWTFNSPNWEHMSEYRLVSKAVDRAANYEISLTTINFTYDIYQADPEKPDSAVVVPDNDQHFNNKFTTISGTSLDNTRGLITEVRLKIRRLPNSDLGESTTYYWDNTAKDWDTDVKSSSANATDEDYNSNYEDWHWDTPQSGLEAISFWKLARKYEVASIVFDKASNIELLLSTNTYVYELDIPTTTITYPVTDGYFSQTGKITGIVQDSIPGKVENVYVRIEQLSGPHIGEFWSVEDMQWTSVGAPEVWNDILAYGTLSPDATWWQLNTAPWQTGETYEVNAYAKDKADNYEFVYSTVTNVAADFTAPTSTMTYPAHQETVSTDLTVITGSASDVDPGVLDKVQLSYKCVSDVCDTKYWNRASGAWDSVAEI